MPDRSGTADSEPPHYSVRWSPHAAREALDATVRLQELSDEATAREWYIGLRAVAGTLGEQPRRYAIQADESRLLGFEARRMLYRRTSSSSAYHLYYRIEDESADGPRVTVVHVRYAARRAMTPKEARQLREDMGAG